MPTVPFGPLKQGQATRPNVDPIFMAIAAADLHEAGMLFEPPQAAYAPKADEPEPKAPRA